MQEVRNSNTVEITEERAERVVLAAVEEGITESIGDMSHRMDEACQPCESLLYGTGRYCRTEAGNSE